MDRLEAMKILLQVARTGSFSAASRQSGIPLATVSRKINELEKHLGARLLTRTTRKVTLTEAGVVYVSSAKRILEEVDDAERIVAGEHSAPRGELTLTAPMLFGRLHVLPIVVDFLAAYPEIDIRLLLSDRTLHLSEEQIDMAVRIGSLPDSRMVATRVGSMRIVICAAAKLLATHGVPQSPERLGMLPCVNFEPLSPNSTWPFRRKGSKEIIDVPIQPRLSVSTADAAVGAATQGAGATRVLHYQCAAGLRDRSLRTILTEYEVQPLPVHLLHAGRGALPSKMRLFLDFATRRLREGLAAI